MFIGILDWGLGHTTRIIPLISYLRQTECQIFIAVTREQRKLIENEVDSVEFVQIEGYNVRYSSSSRLLGLAIISQIPRIWRLIGRENAWLDQLMKIHRFDLIISDNRYGLFHKDCHSVFISHQITILSGLGSLVDGLLRRIHLRLIRRFDECWVPDNDRYPNLSGLLGHPPNTSDHLKYIGPLSRFIHINTPKELDLLIILSGPEPQRTKLETILTDQLKTFKQSYLLVRGIISDQPSALPNSVNYLPGKALNQAICSASMVISRSGYTSIMDLVKCKQKAILIPTPGQTEQEYLARYLHEQGIFLKAKQDDFSLTESLNRVSGFDFKIPDLDFEQYGPVLTRLMQSLPQPSS